MCSNILWLTRAFLLTLASLLPRVALLSFWGAVLLCAGLKVSVEQYEAHTYVVQKNMLASVEKILNDYGLNTKSMSFQVGAPIIATVLLFCLCNALKCLCGCCRKTKKKVSLLARVLAIMLFAAVGSKLTFCACALVEARAGAGLRNA